MKILLDEASIERRTVNIIDQYVRGLSRLENNDCSREDIDAVVSSIVNTRQHYSTLSMCGGGGKVVGAKIQALTEVLHEYRPRMIAKVSFLTNNNPQHQRALLKYFDPRATIASAGKTLELAVFEQQFLKNITSEGITEAMLKSDNLSERKVAYQRWINRAAANKDLFPQILNRRHELAKLKGYTNAYKMLTADQIFGDRAPEIIKEFYATHLPAAKEAADYLLTKYRAIEPTAVIIPAHSFEWLISQEQPTVRIDTMRAVDVFLRFYSKFLSVEITPIDSDLDHAVLVSGDNFNGGIYFSLWAAPNKFSHYAEMAFDAGHTSAVVICSFGKTISIKEAGILAHELTHAFHELGRRGLKLIAGTNMPLDIVEAPAVFMQNYIIEATIRELIPFITLDELKSVKLSIGLKSLSFMNRCTMALFDMQIHTARIPADQIAELYRRTIGDHGLVAIDPNDNSYLSFGHFASGYAGVYYSYITAEILSAKMSISGIKHILAMGGNDISWAVLRHEETITGGADRIKNLDAYPASQFETYVRGRIERLTGKKFPSVYPEWLIYKGRELELDGYCAELNLAFECQGPQHTNFTKMDKAYPLYLRRLENDRAKIQICKARGVGLIIIDFRVPKMLLGSYIRSRIYDVSEAWREAKNKQAHIAALEFLASKAPDYIPPIEYPAVIIGGGI